MKDSKRVSMDIFEMYKKRKIWRIKNQKQQGGHGIYRETKSSEQCHK